MLNKQPTIKDVLKKIEKMKLRQRARDFKERHGTDLPGWDYEKDQLK